MVNTKPTNLKLGFMVIKL